jgi:hypothetical protein
MNCVPLSVMITLGTPKSMDNVGEEQDSLLGVDVGDGLSLDPFGKFVDDYQ